LIPFRVITLKNSFLTTLGCWVIVGLFYISYLLKVTHALKGVFRELLLLPAFFGGIFFGKYTLYFSLKNFEQNSNLS
jgi:hypothetical protein